MSKLRLGPNIVAGGGSFADRTRWTRTHPNSTPAEERAAIVVWLRKQEADWQDVLIGGLADAIERGEHLDGSSK